MTDKPMENARLIVMVGLPRSGKTTIVRKHYKPRGYAIVCPDLVRRAIHGQRFIAETEPFVWATVYAMVDSLLLAGCRVVVDAAHSTKVRRAPWVRREAVFHVVSTSEKECIRRAQGEKDEYIIPSIQRQAVQWEDVDPVAEGRIV